jgi:hypothetical protein
MYHSELYGIESEIEYRKERARATTHRAPKGRRSRRRGTDPYTGWLLRYGGKDRG